MRPELLSPADGPADDRPPDHPAGDRREPGTLPLLLLTFACAAILLAAPALLGPLAVAATAAGLLVALPVAAGRAWHALARYVVAARRPVRSANGVPRD